MDSRTGKIYQIEDIQTQLDLEALLGRKLIDLTPAEHNTLLEHSPEKRPEELAVMRFKETRKKLGANNGLAVLNAFRLGYRAGVKDNV